MRGWSRGRSVNLPASGFNQYNVSVLHSSSSPARGDFARLLTQKFGRGSLLVLGDEAGALEKDRGKAGAATTTCPSVDQLEKMRGGNGNKPSFDRAVWIYRAAQKRDRAIELFAQQTDE